jgi:hypothetical protein
MISELRALQAGCLGSKRVKMAPLWISKSKRATYENFGIFGFSIVENLGYMPVLKTFENFLGIVQSKGRFLQTVGFKFYVKNIDFWLFFRHFGL